MRKPDKFSDALEKEIMDLISTKESEWGAIFSSGCFYKSLRSNKDKDGVLIGFKVTFVDEDSDAIDNDLIDGDSLGEDIYDLITDFEAEHDVEFESIKSKKIDGARLVNIKFNYPEHFFVSNNTNAPIASPSEYHLKELKIPVGYQIYYDNVDVSGVCFRRESAVKFINQTTKWVEFESEPLNKYDSNAIKILGCYQLDNEHVTKLHVGYVPANIAKKINNFSISECMPRLLKTYIGRDDYAEIMIQILGPKAKIREFEQLYAGNDKA